MINNQWVNWKTPSQLSVPTDQTIRTDLLTTAPGNHDVTIATLNAGTLRRYEREVELEHALEEIKFDVLGLSEVRKVGEDILEKKNGDIWYHMGTTPGQKGVGFIVKSTQNT